MRASKIFYICNSTFESGAEKSLAELIGSLDREKFQPTLVVAKMLPIWHNLLPGTTVIVHRMEDFRRTRNPFSNLVYLFTTLKQSRRLSAILQRESAELVHSNSLKAHLYGGIAARLAGVPAVFSMRDHWPGRFTKSIALRLCTKAICISKYILTSAATPDTRLVLIQNGTAPLPATTTNLRTELGLGPSATIVAQIGQLIPWKDAGQTLRTMQAIFAKNRRFHLLFVGEARDNNYLEGLKTQAQAAGLANFVHFIGYRNDMGTVYSGIDILFHPAKKEPFGRVISEAMSAEVPVIARNEGGAQELIEDSKCGLLFSNDREAQFALMQLIDQPELRLQMGVSGRLRWESLFRVEQVSAKTSVLYSKILAP